jgi:hypothetical protein
VLVADHEQLLERWPRFTDELFTHTPFRAVVSLPLRTTGGASGALDLFLVDPDRLDSVTIADAIAITDEIAAAFAIAQAMSSSEWKPDPGSDLEPSWLRTPNSHARATVWIASGVLMTRLHLSASDAVALMRSFAYGHDTVLDQVASDIVHGTLDAGRLLP